MEQVLTERAAFLEAHYYSGGLLYYAYPEPASRPSWAPAPDTVGYRDEVPLGDDDTVVEFTRRSYDEHSLTWLAVYRRSIDAKFGDRKNHAGLGVWLKDTVVANARDAIAALHLLASHLAKTCDASLLAQEIDKFEDRFLPRYITSKSKLPSDWSGAPPTSALIADTDLRVVSAPTFAAGLPAIADHVTRLSMSWDGAVLKPRCLILVTSTDAAEDGIKPLSDTENFSAAIITRLPIAIGAVHEEVQRLRRENTELKSHAESERTRLHQIDDEPASLEGIALRLNGVDRKLDRISDSVLQVTSRPSPPRPSNARPHSIRTIHKVRTSSYDDSGDDRDIVFYVIACSIAIMIAIVATLVIRKLV